MYRDKIQRGIQIGLALVLLYATLYFFSSLKEFGEAFAWGKVPHLLTVFIAICIPGFGLMLAARNFRPGTLTTPIFYGILFLSLLLLCLQTYINIAPSLSSCACVTLADSLRNVQDWTRTLVSVTIFLACLVGCLTYRVQQRKGAK